MLVDTAQWRHSGFSIDFDDHGARLTGDSAGGWGRTSVERESYGAGLVGRGGGTNTVKVDVVVSVEGKLWDRSEMHNELQVLHL